MKFSPKFWFPVCAALLAANLVATLRRPAWPSASAVEADGSEAERLAGQFRRVVDETLPAVVTIRSAAKRDGERVVRSLGSGVLVRPEGVVLTNAHVAGDSDELFVEMFDGRVYTSDRIVRDEESDLAVIRLANVTRSLPTAKLVDSGSLRQGDWVLAMGAPFGLSGSVSAGIVSAKGRRGLTGDLFYQDFIQTDAAINLGNSGGPLVNLRGEVVGINTAIRSNSGGFEGVSFAVPSSLAVPVVEQLLRYGRVRRGYLGITMEETFRDPFATPQGTERGVRIKQLTSEEAPAAKAGVRVGDLLVDIAGRAVNDSKRVQLIVAGLEVGRTVEMRIVRDGRELTVPVTIEEQPDRFIETRSK